MKAHAGRPLVSVVVPTYRRPALLQRCLRGLLEQDLPGERYEIIVANDRPDEETRALVERLAEESGGAPALRYVAVHGSRGPAAARNRGWERAGGAVIAFTDDDTIPQAEWLSQGLLAIDAPRVVAVAGRVVLPLPDDPSDYERDAARLGSGGAFVTANCFVRRWALQRVGGFDERFEAAWREDSDLEFALIERGGDIRYAESAVVLHPLRPAGWGVSLSQQRKIRFDALLYKKHPRLYRERIRAAPRWDYYLRVLLLAGVALAGLLGARGPALACLLAWALATLSLSLRRLRGNALRPAHVLEVLLTSAVIPPLATFWRFAGALRFRVAFI